MGFDYTGKLRRWIFERQAQTGFDTPIYVDSEQSFLKEKDLSPEGIYVLTRELQDDKGIGVDTIPVQILILSEQDSLDEAKGFFQGFAAEWNFKAVSFTENGHNIWLKQQYSDPVVLSNFNAVQYGYRSVLYMNANLYAMEDVVDLKYKDSDDAMQSGLSIDSVGYQVLGFDLAYSMNPNTQQFGGTGYISASKKSVSTLAVTIVVPTVESDLISKVLSILDESDSSPESGYPTDSYGGNEDFVFDFYLGQKHFQNKSLKLISAEFGSAVNEVPSVRLGFMK